MQDPNFVVQGMWSDSRICGEDGADDVEEAIRKARAMVESPLFEGSCVRVITRDGELEWSWESPDHGRNVTIERMKHGWTAVCRLQACFKSDSGEDFLVLGDVNLPPVLSGPDCEYEAIPSHVQVDDPNWSFPNLGRDLSETEEKAALEALFQEAVKRVMACN